MNIVLGCRCLYQWHIFTMKWCFDLKTEISLSWESMHLLHILEHYHNAPTFQIKANTDLKTDLLSWLKKAVDNLFKIYNKWKQCSHFQYITNTMNVYACSSLLNVHVCLCMCVPRKRGRPLMIDQKCRPSISHWESQRDQFNCWGRSVGSVEMSLVLWSLSSL